MKLKIYLFHIILGCALGVHSQNFFSLSYDIDSLKSSYSISGKLNEIDQLSTLKMSSYRPATKTPFLFEPLTVIYNSRPFIKPSTNQSLRYSSLPHIGFSYAFGSNAYQLAIAQYSQAFQNNWLLNIDFNNIQSDGVLRNSGIKNQEISTKLFKRGKKFETFFYTNFGNHFFEWNGGIIQDSLPLSYPLELIPINKENARSERKTVHLNGITHFNIITDSIKKAGFYIQTIFDSQNRVYTETGDLSLFYSQIYLDSFKTRDHLQVSQLGNQLGFFAKNSAWNFHGGLTQRFWNYRNSSLYRDTLELGIAESINYLKEGLTFEQNFELNIIGNGRGWKNQIHLNAKVKELNLKINWILENSFPELFQRYYSANNFSCQLPTYTLQFKSNINGLISYQRNKTKVDLKIGHLYLRNPYLFDGQNWTNQLKPEINAFTITLQSSFKIKILNFKPSYSLCILPSDWKFYPTHHFKFRTWIEGGIFKNKKLKTFIGLEPEVIGSYSPIEIIPAMDVFLFTSSNQIQNSYLDLGFFTGFELNGFKFFARAENLGYFWNNRMLQVMKGYPLPPMQIQIGITWDFWN